MTFGYGANLKKFNIDILAHFFCSQYCEKLTKNTDGENVPKNTGGAPV